MTIGDVKTLLDAEVLTGDEMLSEAVCSACGSDMMSDVLAYVKNQAVLLTGLVNPQVVRTAEMMDMKCIVFVRGKKPEKSVVELAETMGIAVMTTRHRMYTACGILYSNGLQGDDAQ